jgi:hypothetical protein
MQLVSVKSRESRMTLFQEGEDDEDIPDHVSNHGPAEPTMDQLSQANHQIHQYMDPFHGVMQINNNKR